MEAERTSWAFRHVSCQGSLCTFCVISPTPPLEPPGQRRSFAPNIRRFPSHFLRQEAATAHGLLRFLALRIAKWNNCVMQAFPASATRPASSVSSRPLSVVDLFRLGIGPSSSHTVGPMRAGAAFVSELAGSPRANEVRHITVDLFGSLGATGRGHSTDRAVLLGLGGHAPETVSIPEVESLLPALADSGQLPVAGIAQVSFDITKDMRFVPRTVLPYHVNALTITACDALGETLLCRTYYSIGGGFVMEQTNDDPQAPQVRPLDRV